MGNYFLMILVENWHDPTHDHLKCSINKMKVDRPVSSPQNPTQMNHCCCDGTFYLHFSSNNLPDHYKCDNIFFSLHKYTSAVLPFETLHPKISTFGWNKSFSMTLNLSLGVNFEETSNNNKFERCWTSLQVLIKIFVFLFTKWFGRSNFLWYPRNHLKTLLYC